jgi:hypothetical protein
VEEEEMEEEEEEGKEVEARARDKACVVVQYTVTAEKRPGNVISSTL